MTATEVESLISLPLETVLNATQGVSMIKSLSMNNISSITIIFKNDMELYKCRQMVAEKLQTVQNKLPVNISQPVMLPVMSMMGDILKIGITSKEMSPMDLRTLCDWEIKNKLLSIGGVARVIVMGGEQKQYQVVVDSKSLLKYNLTMDNIATAIEQANSILPGGYYITHDQTFIINANTKVNSIEDLKNSVVASINNTPILLKDLATVKIGSEYKIGDAIINGQPGIEITITKQPFTDTIKTTKAVEEALNSVITLLPKDAHITTLFRQSDFINNSINNVLAALLFGGILVVGIVAIFLNNWRMALISLYAIPLSLISATLIIKLFGGTINTMTLGGLAIACGEVVDDALVDVENIFKKIKMKIALGEKFDYKELILEACNEVRQSVVFATLIVATVFIPVFTLGGVEGKIFTPLGMSYILATLSSLLVAIFVTPAMSAYLLTAKLVIPKRETFIIDFIKTNYENILAKTIYYSNLVVLLSLSLFLIAIILVPFMGQSFLPQFKEPSLIIGATSLPGQSLEATIDMGQALENNLLKSQKVTSISQRAGRAELDDDSAGPYYSEFDCKIPENSLTWEQNVDKIRSTFEKIPGTVFDIGSFIQHRMDDVLSGGTKADIAIKLFGPDLSILRNKANEIAQILKEVKGTCDVRPETQVLVPEVEINFNRTQAARYGISSFEFARNIQNSFYGSVVSNVIEKQKQFPLKIILDQQNRDSIDSVKNTYIDTPDNNRIPLLNIATVSVVEKPNVIIRENVARRIVIQANCKDRDVVSIINDTKKLIRQKVKLPQGYYLDFAGQYKARTEAANVLFFSSILSLILVIVLLRQGLPNWYSTFLVLLNLPLSSIGGILAVYLTSNELSIGSLIGFISLFGISTRNSLLLVSKIDSLITSGYSVRQAVEIGCQQRVIPIIMTALCAALGMLPLAILSGPGRELEHPLAIVIVGGLVSSTSLVLLVIPAIFIIFKKSNKVLVN